MTEGTRTLWRRGIVGAAAILVAAVCLRLGFWQLDRLDQRAARNAVIEARLAAPPLNGATGLDADTSAYRRGIVAGVFDFDRQVIEQGRVVNGVPAVYVVTPLVTDAGRIVLVERGYALSPDARGVDVSLLREPDTAAVEGVFVPLDGGRLPTDRSWPLYMRRADPAVLRELYAEPLAPLVLRRTALPPGAPRGLAPAPLPPLSRGPHLSYAVQWFVFAAIALVGPLAASGVFRRKP